VIFLLVNNEDILKVLGKNIKKVRKEKGYTQDYVAEQINISTDLLRSIENDLTTKTIMYQGLGYEVELVKDVTNNKIIQVEMYMFNKCIAGAIE